MESKGNGMMQASDQASAIQSAAGWGRIEISPTAITSFEYHNFRVSIYQRVCKNAAQADQHQFYYAPSLILRPESAKSVSNPFKKMHQVTFEVSMWDKSLEQLVQVALTTHLNRNVSLTSIAPLPIEQIRLEALEDFPSFTVDSRWICNGSNFQKTMTFFLNCMDKAACDDLAQSIKDYPELFVADLVVKYSLEAQQSSRRAITIKAQHARTAALATTLDQKFPGKDIIYLKADDAKKLSLEITTKVMATEIMDGIVRHDQSVNIMDLIKTALELTSVGTERFSDEMWSSTFWHDENARPDKITHTLNEIYDKSDSKTKVLMKNELAEASKNSNKQATSQEMDGRQSANAKQTASSNASHAASSKAHCNAKIGGFGVNASVDAGSESNSNSKSSSRSCKKSGYDNSFHTAQENSSETSSEGSKNSKNEDDRLDNLLNEAKSVARWDGEKFIPKAMELTRVNMAALRSSVSLGTVQIQVTQTTATLSGKINVLAADSTPHRYMDEIVAHSTKMICRSGIPDIYEARLIETGSDSTHKLRRYRIGAKPGNINSSKVILMLGGTGAGKTAVVNSLLNYTFGVKWDDGVRLKFTADEEDKTQQTEYINVYDAYCKEHGSPCPRSLTVIDTPGFGHTEGMARDREITAQLQKLFTQESNMVEGIDHLDAICIVVQSHLSLLNATARYIFTCILSIFGKDVANNIFLFCTFADEKEPPVVRAAEAFRLPFSIWFPFDNSVLYTDNGPQSSKFRQPYWDMGHASTLMFFETLREMQPYSLELSREVYAQREAVETAVSAIFQLADAAKTIMAEIYQTQCKIQQKQDLARRRGVQGPASKHSLTRWEPLSFSAVGDVEAVNFKRAELPSLEKRLGRLLSQLAQLTEKQTVLQTAYQHDGSADTSVRISLYRLQEQLESVEKLLRDSRDRTATCYAGLNRLDEIALRSRVTCTKEYIDTLIQSNNSDERLDFRQRLEALKQAKERATIIEEFHNFLDATKNHDLESHLDL